MTKRMLVDATHPEETRVAIVDGNWLSDFDFERASKKQLKGNIYLAKVIRIEPSLQAAFVEYGGNRHGFLPFSEIHPDYFRIPMADRPHDEEDDGDHAHDAADPEALETDEQIAAENAAQHDSNIENQEDYDGEIDEDRVLYAEPHIDAEVAAQHEVSKYSESSNYEAPSSAVVEIPTLAIPLPSFDEFGHAPTHDLGLITDFGNAVVGTPNLGPEHLMAEQQAPLEVIGGEAAEEERYRRQPRPRYKIQEVVKRRQVMLIQVVKEERGNKGAALTTFLSLAGRYCVLMPNTESGGGVSRKITSHQDRRRMKEMLEHLEVPEGMAVILRTAGMEQEPVEIQRDLEYLLRLWNNIREQTLQSTAPALIYEEANLIKRSMRDLYAHDVGEILVAGQKGYQLAIDFMRAIMPDQLDKVKLYEDAIPLFFRYNVEKQIDQLYNPTVQLRSGGYIVINPTEALVSIDVNSGRATRERHIESTALKTNLEAAEEIARQLRLRDLAGLIVIDFIDMEDGRNNAAVERRMKEAMRVDRARLQIGRISPFGLLELSRQRLRPSLTEINFEKCPHCVGLGLIRSVDSAAISILRMIEEEGIKQGGGEMTLHVPSKVALYILNQKRGSLSEIERRYGITVLLHSDEALVPPDFKLERGRGGSGGEIRGRAPLVNSDQILADDTSPREASEAWTPPASYNEGGYGQPEGDETTPGQNTRSQGRRRGGRSGRGGRDRNNNNRPHQDRPAQAQNGASENLHSENNGNIVEAPSAIDDGIGNVNSGFSSPPSPGAEGSEQDGQRRGRRRGRRGGRGRRPPREDNQQPTGSNPQQGSGFDRRDRRPSRNFENVPPGIASASMATPSIPTSIHEIDTTPRDPAPGRVRPSAPQSSSPYEVIADAGDKPKGGWWRKLTGQ